MERNFNVTNEKPVAHSPLQWPNAKLSQLDAAEGHRTSLIRAL